MSEKSHTKRESSTGRDDIFNIIDSVKQQYNMGYKHKEEQLKAKSESAIPSIEEMLHWADELGLIKGVHGLSAATAKNEEILRGIKQSFRDSFLLVASSYKDDEINGIIKDLLTTVGQLPESSEAKIRSADSLKVARVKERKEKGLPPYTRDEEKIFAAAENKVIKERELGQLGNTDMSLEARIATLFKASIAIRARIEILGTPKVSKKETTGPRVVRGLDISMRERQRLSEQKARTYSASKITSSGSGGENYNPNKPERKKSRGLD